MVEWQILVANRQKAWISGDGKTLLPELAGVNWVRQMLKALPLSAS